MQRNLLFCGMSATGFQITCDRVSSLCKDSCNRCGVFNRCSSTQNRHKGRLQEVSFPSPLPTNKRAHNQLTGIHSVLDAGRKQQFEEEVLGLVHHADKFPIQWIDAVRKACVALTPHLPSTARVSSETLTQVITSIN